MRTWGEGAPEKRMVRRSRRAIRGGMCVGRWRPVFWLFHMHVESKPNAAAKSWPAMEIGCVGKLTEIRNVFAYTQDSLDVLRFV